VPPKPFAEFAARGESECSIKISDKITAPANRQTIKRGHRWSLISDEVCCMLS